MRKEYYRIERNQMELKELTLKICDIFGCSSITTLPDKVMFALFSQNRFLYL